MGIFDRYMIGLVIFVTAVFISRRVAAGGLEKLDADKKVLLIDLFSGSKTWHYVFLVVTVLAFYLAVRFTEIPSLSAFLAYTILIIGYVVLNNVSAYRKLRANAFPDDYIRSYLIASTVRLVGIFVFFAMVVMEI